MKQAGKTLSPMPNPFSSQQNGIVQVLVCGRPIAKRLPGMEYKGYLNTQLLLTFLEAK